MKGNLADEVLHCQKELTALRRRFHACPETAWQEYHTTRMIREYLGDCGFELRPLPGRSTGVMAVLDCGTGPVLTLRFDIDALPIQESTSASHPPVREHFVSETPGKMHACGHDGHIALGLITAKLLYLHRQDMRGTLQLLFQPAEEGCRGALPIAQSGLLDSTDIFLSGHIVPAAQYPQADGDFIVTDGSLATTKLDVSYHGKAAHAAHPQDGCSVMPAVGNLLTRLYGLTDPANPDTVLNVGVLTAGTGRNILADLARMEIEVRGNTTEKNRELTQQTLQAVEAAARACGVQSEVNIVGSAPSLKSTQGLTEQLYRIFQDTSLPVRASSLKTTAFMASEDAAHLMEAVKDHGGEAAYLLFPARSTAVLHQPDYTFDEAVLPKAVFIYCLAALYFLKKQD